MDPYGSQIFTAFISPILLLELNLQELQTRLHYRLANWNNIQTVSYAAYTVKLRCFACLIAFISILSAIQLLLRQCNRSETRPISFLVLHKSPGSTFSRLTPVSSRSSSSAEPLAASFIIFFLSYVSRLGLHFMTTLIPASSNFLDPFFHSFASLSIPCG